MTRRSPAATVSLARRALLTSALLTSALLTSALLTSALLTSALLTSACSSDSGSSAAALDAAGGAGSGDRAADVGTPGGPGAGRSGGASAEADAGGAQGLGGDATPASSDAAAGPSREPGLPSTAVRPQRPSSWVSHPDRVPTAIHMTFQEDPATSVTFTWATGATDLEAYTPRVWLVPAAEVAGDDDIMPLGAGWVSEGTGHAYQTVLLDTVVDETVYVRWTVVVEGLQPATDYVWRVGSWGGFDAATGALVDPDLSARGSVRTATSKGSREPFTVVLAGDSRGGNQPIRDHMDVFTGVEAELWFFNGDFSQGGTQPEWADWYDAMQPIMTTHPMMTVRGNHEIFADLYYDQIALPVEPGLPPEMVENAWTIDYGNVHFVGLDSNGADAAEAQVDFLSADLAAARADADIDYIVVMMHHGVYSASNHGNTSWVHTHWVPLFEQYNVDLVFSGHDHNYERTHPIREDAVVEGGITYVVAGAFFAPPYGNGNEWWTATSTHGDKGCFAVLHVDGDQLSLTALSGDGTEVLDELTLPKRK